MDRNKRNVVISLMVAMSLAAVEATVVTTAIPTIVNDLNGFSMISWVFSLYLLCSAISTPIYGKLSDLYGRKNILSIGILIFLFGSILCGLSNNMYQLIGFRAIQGLGAGSIFTVTYTIVGDIFSMSERARVQGWLGSVWGISSLAGPLLGGFLIDHLSWHWIFFINIPFGLISILLLKKNLSENIQKKNPSIDYLGTFVLTLTILSILFFTMSGIKISTLPFINISVPIFISISLLWLFYSIEKKAKEPIIPLEIFTSTSIIVSAISFLSAGILIGLSVYMPIYLQNILGLSATLSGLSMAPMSVSWILSSVILAKTIPKYGEKIVITTTFALLLFSCLFLSTLGIQSPVMLAIFYIFLMGFGFGGAFTALTIVIQSLVDYSKRGVATSTNSLLRTFGQTIFISVFGSIFNLNIVKYLNNIGIMGVVPGNLYSKSSLNIGLSNEVIKRSLNFGLYYIFIGFIIISIFCILLSLKLENNLKEKEGCL